VSKKKKKEERGNSIFKGGLEESKIALWCKRTTPKRSQNEYGGVDNAERGGDLCRVSWVQL